MWIATWFVLAMTAVAPPGQVVTGVVVDAQGHPAPGAEVMAAGGRGDGLPAAVLARSTTDEAGRFALELPDDALGTDRPALWAVRSGSIAASMPLDRDALVSTVRLALGAGERSTVRVAGPDGPTHRSGLGHPRTSLSRPWRDSRPRD